jgi:hypothetical protein
MPLYISTTLPWFISGLLSGLRVAKLISPPRPVPFSEALPYLSIKPPKSYKSRLLLCRKQAKRPPVPVLFPLLCHNSRARHGRFTFRILDARKGQKCGPSSIELRFAPRSDLEGNVRGSGGDGLLPPELFGSERLVMETSPNLDRLLAFPERWVD